MAAFEYDLEENLIRLREELAAFAYSPGPYRSFYVRDAKRRLVSAASFSDRVVHHALVHVIEPLFEPRFVKRTLRCRAYLRYVDDCLFFADDKPTLHGWRAATIERLAGLRVTLHENRAQVYPVTEGIPFLGFRVFPDHRRLKSRRGHAARRRLQALAREYTAGRVDVARLTASVQG